MTNWKAFYKEKAKHHFEQYEKALEPNDQKAADYHSKEYLTYDKASK